MMSCSMAIRQACRPATTSNSAIIESIHLNSVVLKRDGSWHHCEPDWTVDHSFIDRVNVLSLLRIQDGVLNSGDVLWLQGVERAY